MKTIKRVYFTTEEANINLNSLVNPDENSNKLVNLIDLRFGDCWAVFSDVEIEPWANQEPEAEPSVSVVNRWKNRFKFIYETTYDRYNKLLDLYKANEANLMNSIKIETTTSGKDSGTHSQTGSGSDSDLLTGDNSDTNTRTSTDSGIDKVTLSKTGENTDIGVKTVTNSGTDRTTETDTRKVTNSGKDSTVVTDTTTITNSGTDRTIVNTSNNSKLGGSDSTTTSGDKISNDTPQVVLNGVVKDDYATLAEKSKGNNTVTYGKTETGSSNTSTSLENGLKQTHGGSVSTEVNNGLTQTHSGALTTEVVNGLKQVNDDDVTHSFNTTDTTSTEHGHVNTVSDSTAHKLSEKHERTNQNSLSGNDSRTSNGSSITLDDRKSIIEKLDDIHAGYHKLYKDWVNEFESLYGDSII